MLDETIVKVRTIAQAEFYSEFLKAQAGVECMASLADRVIDRVHPESHTRLIKLIHHMDTDAPIPDTVCCSAGLDLTELFEPRQLALSTPGKTRCLDYRYKKYPTESHMSEPVVAYFDALCFILWKWAKPR